jgi:predicted RNase H-like nuclease
LGIDGCKTGWVVISSDTALGDLDCRIVAPDAIDSLLRESDQVGDLIAIDIPIGLAESAPRRCDLAARKLLGGARASSVFPAPCRSTLTATSYAEACDLNQKASGRRISRQNFGILSKIRAIDDALTPDLQRTVRESHPEVVFARLSDEGRGLNSNKKTPEGRSLRQAILRRYLPEFDAEQIRSTLGRSAVALDDVIDAAACLVAAHRIAQGTACVLPCDRSESDQRGLRMEIVA